MDDQSVIHEFLIESNEGLVRLENQIVELERKSDDPDLVGSIFRVIHTIKGTCGFLGFNTLERIAHETETILSQVRAGERQVSGELVSLILEVIDAIRMILVSVEATGEEGPDRYEDLVRRLKDVATAASPAPGTAPVLSAPPARKSDPVFSAPPATESGSALFVPPTLENAPVLSAPPSPPRLEDPGESTSATGDGDPETPQRILAADSAIRVDVGLLDKLMNLVGELVLARNQIVQHSIQNEDSSLNATSQRLNLITSELQEGVMKTRMQPVGVVWNKLPRLVRDISLTLGKQIRLEMDGATTELDRTIIEAIKDPLIHLIRNCCDHGIELPAERLRAGKPVQGRITLRAYHEGGQVNIEISDDGAGMNLARIRQKAVEMGILRPEEAERIPDRQALQLVFQSGFSTAEKVTNVSGRGVGMDVVRSNIEQIGGLVDLTGKEGEGTTVRLKIPLTLAIIPGLVVLSGGERFIIPQVSLVELVRLEGDARRRQIENIHGTPVYRRRGRLLPIAHLHEVLGLHPAEGSDGMDIVVLQADDRQFGLVVDSIHDTQEIVVKPLAKHLKGLTVYAGATIVGDGRVALILDVVGIGQRSGVLNTAVEQSRDLGHDQEQLSNDTQRLLIFRAGSFERLAIPLSLVSRLEEFPRSQIEHAGGQPVVQYRGRILPLMPMSTFLEGADASNELTQDLVPIVVFSDGGRSVGLIVDQIIDIVEQSITTRQRVSCRGLLGSAVVGNQVVDLVDLSAVFSSSDWLASRSTTGDGGTVLLADASQFARTLLRSGLESAGYRVVEAASESEVVRVLGQETVDVLAVSLDLPPNGGNRLLEVVRQTTNQQRLPAMGLCSSPDQIKDHPNGLVAFEDYQHTFDWKGIIQSIDRLKSPDLETAAAPAGRSYGG